MATTSNVRIIDNDKVILCLYLQYDGYPSGVGEDIKKFLIHGELVNGIPITRNGIPVAKEDWFFNGVDDLAAQLVAYLKIGSKFSGSVRMGYVYIYPSEYKPGNNMEEYLYDISIRDNKPYIEISIPYKGTKIAEGFADEIDMLTIES